MVSDPKVNITRNMCTHLFHGKIFYRLCNISSTSRGTTTQSMSRPTRCLALSPGEAFSTRMVCTVPEVCPCCTLLNFRLRNR